VTVTATVHATPYRTSFVAGAHAGLADTRKDGIGGDAGLRPHELLEAALATCMAITARMAMESMGIPDPAAVVAVRVDRAAGPAVRYRLTADPRLDACQRAAVAGRVERSPVVQTVGLAVIPEASGDAAGAPAPGDQRRPPGREAT